MLEVFDVPFLGCISHEITPPNMRKERHKIGIRLFFKRLLFNSTDFF
jgi:hypothetical protein